MYVAHMWLHPEVPAAAGTSLPEPTSGGCQEFGAERPVFHRLNAASAMFHIFYKDLLFCFFEFYYSKKNTCERFENVLLVILSSKHCWIFDVWHFLTLNLTWQPLWRDSAVVLSIPPLPAAVQAALSVFWCAQTSSLLPFDGRCLRSESNCHSHSFLPPLLLYFFHILFPSLHLFSSPSPPISRRHPSVWLQRLTRLLKCQRVSPALTHLWWHTHLSRLCFFALFFFFSLWVGEELPNLLMETKKRFACHDGKADLLNSGSSVLAVWLFVLISGNHCEAPSSDICSPPTSRLSFASLSDRSFFLSLFFWPCQKTVIFSKDSVI